MRDLSGVSGARGVHCVGIGTLAVALICSTFPAPQALADSGRELLLAQAYQTPPAQAPQTAPPESPPMNVQPPPAYPPSEPPPPGYQPPSYYPPPAYPPAYPQQGYGPPQQPGEIDQATLDAKADADANISGVLWFCAGFFLTWIGILLGYLLSPTPDGARFIGKSPTYVTAYTTAYQSEGKSFRR